MGGSYWLNLTRGIALIEGRVPMGPGWRVDWPEALPFFVLAGVAGAVSGLLLAFVWLEQQGTDEDATATKFH